MWCGVRVTVHVDVVWGGLVWCDGCIFHGVTMYGVVLCVVWCGVVKWGSVGGDCVCVCVCVCVCMCVCVCVWIFTLLYFCSRYFSACSYTNLVPLG